MDISIGQELEFIEPTSAQGVVIPKGTRVRVGHIMTELMEPKVMLTILGESAARTIQVERHIVTLHCRIVGGTCG